MDNEFRESWDTAHHIDLTSVPDWNREPGSGLWELGKPLRSITTRHTPESVTITPEVATLRQNLESHISPTFFNGPMANLEHLTFSEDGMELETTETDFFTYLASSYAHRGKQGENPVRTLAVQASVLSPEGSKLIMDRRPDTITDHPSQLWVVGGVLPPALKPEEALQTIVNKKYGLDVSLDQLQPTGIVRDNISNIYCLTYTIDLTSAQYDEGHARAKSANRNREKHLYQISTDYARQSIEQMIKGKRPVHDWDPNAIFNILYALGAKGLRTKEQLQLLVETMRNQTNTKPIDYKFPMEKYL